MKYEKCNKIYKGILDVYEALIDTLERTEPYKMEFLESIGVMLEDIDNMTFELKSKLNEKWRQSEQYRRMQDER